NNQVKSKIGSDWYDVTLEDGNLYITSNMINWNTCIFGVKDKIIPLLDISVPLAKRDSLPMIKWYERQMKNEFDVPIKLTLDWSFMESEPFQKMTTQEQQEIVKTMYTSQLYFALQQG